MMRSCCRFVLGLLIIGVSLLAHAETDNRFVIHVPDFNERSLNGAIENAKVLIRYFGKTNIKIEVVANSYGVSLVNKKNRYVASIQSLMNSGVRFSACNATLNRYREQNKPVNLVEGVKVVPFGIIRVAELQNLGYKYIRP